MKTLREMKIEDKILWILGICCLILFCVGGFLLLDYFLESRKQEKINEELSKLKHGYTSDIFVVVEAEPLEKGDDSVVTEGFAQMEQEKDAEGDDEEQSVALLREINPDYVFWLQIPETVIDYPVVYKDNDYYLRRDFYGEKNKHGTIFLDVSCGLSDEFLLLHGHNMKDGTMFGSLRNFKDNVYRSQHKEIILGMDKEEVRFQIVAGAIVDLYDAERFVFEVLPETEAETRLYFAELKEHALWCDYFEWEPGQRVVLLSTCDYGSEEERFVVIAVEKEQ